MGEVVRGRIKIRRPSVWMAMGFIIGIGICCYNWMRIMTVVIMFVLGISVICRRITYEEYKVKIAIIVFMALLVILRTLYISSKISNIEDISGKVVDCIGYVGWIDEKENTYALKLEHTIIEDKDDDATVLVYIKKEIGNPKIGDRIRFFGEVYKFEESSNLGEFDEYKYYVKQLGYSYKAYIDEYKIVKDYFKIDKYRYLLLRNLNDIRDDMMTKLDRIYGDSESGVLKAMLFGDKSNLNEEVNEAYKSAGINHILAISGLHISLIAMVLYTVFISIGCSKKASSVCVVIFIVMYGMMVGMSISTWRAIFVMTVVMIGRCIHRTADTLNSLAISVIILLWKNPYSIENTSFLLSYMAILGIIVVAPIVEKGMVPQRTYIRNKAKIFINRITGNIDDYRYVLSIGDMVSKIYKTICKSIIVSLGIMLVTVPVLIESYYEVNLLSIVVNILVVPLVSLVIIMSVLSVLCGYISISIGLFCGGCVSYILKFYQKIGEICDNFKYSNIIVGHRSASRILIYYVGLVVVLYIVKNKECDNYTTKSKGNSYMNNTRTVMSRWRIAVPLISLLLILLIDIPYTNNLDITMLDVSQGECNLIRTPSGINILIDGGSTDEKDVYKYKIMPYLKYEGIRKINYMMITHTDMDHISGLLELLLDDTFEVEYMCLTEAHKECEYYEGFCNIAKKKNIPIIYLKAGHNLRLGDVRLMCIHPDEEYISDNKNAYSLTMYLQYKKFDMLYCGDLEMDGEEIVGEAIIKNKKRKIDVLKVPHHGSKYSSTEKFLDIIRPTYAIISAGINNMYGHPHKETLDRYKNVGSQIYVTSKEGIIKFFTDGYTVRKYEK